MRNDYIIVISDDVDILDETNQCEQVYAILLTLTENDRNKIDIGQEIYKKVCGIFTDQTSMLIKLQQTIINVEHQISQNVGDLFKTFNRQERSLRDVRNDLAIFMWRQVFKSR